MPLTGNKLFFLLMGLSLGAAAQAAPMLLYSQDGRTYKSLEAISGNETDAEFYGYRKNHAHPDFGTLRSTASTAMYWDQTHSILSLVSVSGATGSRFPDRGWITWHFTGLPDTTYLRLCDDPGETRYRRHASEALLKFQYRNSTDGLVFGGLSDKANWIIQIAIPSHVGVKRWRLVDGDVNNGGQFIALNMNQPLYLRMVSGASLPPASGGSDAPSSPPIPEPGAAGIALTTLGWWMVRRRHR